MNHVTTIVPTLVHPSGCGGVPTTKSSSSGSETIIENMSVHVHQFQGRRSELEEPEMFDFGPDVPLADEDEK